MKRIATMALMLNLGVASVYAQQHPVKMVFSGTSAASTVNLQQPDTSNDEDNFAGKVRWAHSPFVMFARSQFLRHRPALARDQIKFNFADPAGAGVFRFQDGSLLKVNLTQGAIALISRLTRATAL